MSSNIDKGAALEIMRHTVKVAAAPAVGGLAGAPAPEPGPLNPGGGGTQGGSNNPQMQTGWASGKMRQALIKRFTANAANKMKQSVSTAAGRQNTVGGMGSGMPKMASIGGQLEKRAWGPLKLGGGAGKALWGGARALFGGSKAAPAVARQGDLFRKAIPTAQEARAAAQAAERARKAKQVADTAEKVRRSRLLDLNRNVGPGGQMAFNFGNKSRAGRILDSAQRAFRGSRAGQATQKATKTVTEAAKRETAAARALGRGSTYTEPAGQGLKHWAFHRGSGLRNIWRNKETGELVRGSRGYFRRPPEGFEKFKSFTQTGGYGNRAIKNTLAATGTLGATGYGASYLANPTGWRDKETGKTRIIANLTDPPRLDMAGGAATLGVGATLPGMAYTGYDMFTGGPLHKQFMKGTASGIALANSPGGISYSRGRGQGGATYTDVLNNLSPTSDKLESQKHIDILNKNEPANKKKADEYYKALDKKIDSSGGGPTGMLLPGKRQDRQLASTRGTSKPVTVGDGSQQALRTGDALRRASAKKPSKPTFTDVAVGNLDPTGTKIFRGAAQKLKPPKENRVAKLQAKKRKLTKAMANSKPLTVA